MSEAEIARIVAALRPFARIADMTDSRKPGSSVIVNVDLLRAARASLTNKGEG